MEGSLKAQAPGLNRIDKSKLMGCRDAPWVKPVPRPRMDVVTKNPPRFDNSGALGNIKLQPGKATNSTSKGMLTYPRPSYA